MVNLTEILLNGPIAKLQLCQFMSTMVTMLIVLTMFNHLTVITMWNDATVITISNKFTVITVLVSSYLLSFCKGVFSPFLVSPSCGTAPAFAYPPA